MSSIWWSALRHSPAGQRLPQLPQLVLLVGRWRQRPSQVVWPRSQTQVRLVQRALVGADAAARGAPAVEGIAARPAVRAADRAARLPVTSADRRRRPTAPPEVGARVGALI